jgi:hypothetical protein
MLINYYVINGEVYRHLHTLSIKQNNLPFCRTYSKSLNQTTSLFVVKII